MTTCVIFGGAGFIGTHLARHLLASGRFTQVHVSDIRPSPLAVAGLTTSFTDVRGPIPADLVPWRPSWVFNLAAVHREPGHARHEYFDTNVSGARNVGAYATATGCANIYFTSSISVYGPRWEATAESSPINPTSPYGESKFEAETIHREWLEGAPERRLVISRPGVIYGPGDPGNILRMIRAVRRGYFAFPGSPSIHKSYGYIFGLLESIDFTLARPDRLLVYNYVESPTEPLGALVRHVKAMLHSRAPVLSLPLPLLLPAAHLAQTVLGSRNPIHPVRVRKAAMPTHIVPKTLTDLGFVFHYPFPESLQHWRRIAPQDFGD